MFDQVETFSSNSLHYKQMFDCLATLSQKQNKAFFGKAGKSNQSQAVFPARDCVDLAFYVIISAGAGFQR